jgi:ketosteroid isomerase-like protein
MSQENVEIVRRAVEAYAREGLDGSLRYYAPEIEWSTTDVAIERATYRGHDGLRRFFAMFDDLFNDLRFDVEDLIDAGET